MRKFVKGDLETIVEEGDRRIPEYLANGWKEAALIVNANGEASATDKAKADVAASEKMDKPKGKGGRSKNTSKTAQKLNEAISANSNAAVESEVVDDGLEKKEGE